MLSRTCFSLLLGAILIAQTGCHRAPWPCGNTYCGMQCGCLYWHEWFSHKPCCCDPCNQCGHYVGSRNPYVKGGPHYTRFGEVYSDGSGSNAPGAVGELYNAPSPGTGPTPAQPPSGMLEDEGPIPAEELPGPTTTMPRQGAGRMAARQRLFDSAPPSRTLGSPPRTRLFTR